MRQIKSTQSGGDERSGWTIEDAIADYQLGTRSDNQIVLRSLYRLTSLMIYEFNLDIPPYVISIGSLPEKEFVAFYRNNEFGSGCHFKFAIEFIERIRHESTSCRLVQPLFFAVTLAAAYKAEPNLESNFENPIFQKLTRKLGVNVNRNGSSSYRHGRFVELYLNVLNEAKRRI